MNEENRNPVWRGRWIAAVGIAEPRVPLFEKSFRVDREVHRAVWRLAAGGFAAARINGSDVGDHLMEPAFTDYSKTVLFVTHEVTGLFRPGENRLRVLLANGWFNPCSEDTWGYHRAHWRGVPRFLAQLEIDWADGGRTVIATGRSWRWTPSAILESDLRVGETGDAGVAEDGPWFPAAPVAAPGGELRPQLMPPVRVVEEWPATRIDTGTEPGRMVFDAGRNIAGFVRLQVAGRAGDGVRINYAERIDAAGNPDNSRIDEYAVAGRPFQQDRYFLRGGGPEEWQPRFVYHGFRYIEILAPAGTEIRSVNACWCHTAFERTGSFRCSHGLFNRIQELCLASFRSNYQGLPIDCPHREKNGWTGDAMIAAQCGLLNFDVADSYRKWLDDCRDAMRDSGELPGIVPSPGWGFDWGNGPCWDAAYLHIAWQLYVHTADRAVLERHYEPMCRYGDFLAREKWNRKNLVDWGLADWVPPHGTPMAYTAPREFFSSAYTVLIWRLLGKIAAVLERREDADRYRAWSECCRHAVNLEYCHPKSGEYASGSQSAQAVALHLELPDPADRPRAQAALLRLVETEEGRMNCGFLGAAGILHALSEAGPDGHAAALRLASRTDYPSWGYMLAHGATTLWESWQGNSSLNHVLFSDISHWFYRAVAGIRPDEDRPGFRHYFIEPRGRRELEFAEARIGVPAGEIKVVWRWEGDTFRLTLIQPPGCTATVCLPDGSVREAVAPASVFCCVPSKPEARAEHSVILSKRRT